MSIQILLTIVFGVIAVIFLYRRFSRGRYGMLRPSREVGKAFESFQVQNHLRYYTSGPVFSPNAMMALDAAWMLDDGLWTRQDMTPAMMKKLVQGMQERNGSLFGFDMVDHRGIKIGEWFSVLDTQTSIALLDGNRVSVSTPPGDTYSPP